MEATISNSIFMNEFLESILGSEQKIVSFVVEPGSNIGDGYMSVVYSINIVIEEKNQNTRNIVLLLKCFPTNPARQQMLKHTNMFWKEVELYQTLFPKLSSIARRKCLAEDQNNPLPFPPFIGGKAIDFHQMMADGDLTFQNKVYKQFENYLVMTDMKKTYGYRLADKKKMLELEHVKLAVKALSKFHAYSWAYKQNENIQSLESEYKCVQLNMDDKTRTAWRNVFISGMENAANVLKKMLPEGSPVITSTLGLIDFTGAIWDVIFPKNYPNFGTGPFDLISFHRDLSTHSKGNDEPWRLLIHGDCLANNMLFQYSDENQELPISIILIDLQLLCESCPTFDLAKLFYTSTTAELRRNHLNDLLKLYHDELVKNCNDLDVSVLPGFCLSELERRFHLSKVFGYTIGVTLLPIMFRDPKDIENPELVEQDDVENYFKGMTETVGKNTEGISLIETRIVELAQELYDQGVI